VLAGKLKHHRSLLLDWQMSNARVEYRGEARALTKPDQVADSPRKIDGVIALICAFAAMQTLPATPDYKIFFVS
jgi:phage terminase large subunit-like protein